MNNNTKNILIGILIVALVGMTVAYAAFSTTLRINGTASVANTTWDVHLANIAKQTGTASLVSGQTNTAEGNTPTISNGTAITNLAVTLKQPGDKVVYTFNIANTGTIDAKLASFSDSFTRTAGATMTQTEIDQRFMHTMSCSPAQSSVGTSLNHGSSATCTLTLAWKEAIAGTTGQASQTAGENQTFTQGAITFNYTAQWTYIQK